MKLEATSLPGVFVLEPNIHRDARGSIAEIFRSDAYSDFAGEFKQSNISVSRRGVLRGLHFQSPLQQAKLVTVLAGDVFDVVVDVRHGSDTFAGWFGIHLSGPRLRQVWVPKGFAHGFCVLSDEAQITYSCTEHYVADCDRAIRWDDPLIGIDWPLDKPLLSPRDAAAPCLEDLAVSLLPVL